ncbi:myosin-15 isoform X1 [Tanacetum coccineum]
MYRTNSWPEQTSLFAAIANAFHRLTLITGGCTKFEAPVTIVDNTTNQVLAAKVSSDLHLQTDWSFVFRQPNYTQFYNGDQNFVQTLTACKLLNSVQREMVWEFLLTEDADVTYGRMNDMSRLDYLNEPAVLDNFKKRHALHEIYNSTLKKGYSVILIVYMSAADHVSPRAWTPMIFEQYSISAGYQAATTMAVNQSAILVLELSYISSEFFLATFLLHLHIWTTWVYKTSEGYKPWAAISCLNKLSPWENYLTPILTPEGVCAGYLIRKV